MAIRKLVELTCDDCKVNMTTFIAGEPFPKDWLVTQHGITVDKDGKLWPDYRVPGGIPLKPKHACATCTAKNYKPEDIVQDLDGIHYLKAAQIQAGYLGKF